MSASRRRESLIPLSREHHYGLLVCLRIHRGMDKHNADPYWLRDRAEKTISFFESELRTHFAVEEQIVFPAMREIKEAIAVIDQLTEEHRRLAALADRLRSAQNVALCPILCEFADLLEAHIRKEERVLFPCYERNIAPQEDSQVQAQVLQRIGSAMKPKRPELLE